ncbi:efflux RND transporter periplasmic adaptor subunit [Neorhizobium sp. DAR64872/K0K18]|uniref:efflux RND transporter periplasmic adaptor subunit n=1 Tax=Neorhizobium sp. DAR64872/K0K18 TaxID=3421958 RepID=UPI003D2CC977
MKSGTLLVATTALSVVAVAGYAAGSLGYGKEHFARASSVIGLSSGERSPATGSIIYHQHPDGLPEYSAAPKQTFDGRSFRDVRQSEDVSFEPVAPSQVRSDAEPSRKVLYYRNPMGLPDTSSIPKKDSMGMDYLPVYEGDQPQAGELRVQLGKLQRTGVRTAAVVSQPIQQKIRVPGVVQFDERRIRVVSMRTDAFINEVAMVTTGDTVRKGEKLFSFYSGDIARAAAEFAASLRTGGGGLSSGVGLQLRNLGVPDETIRDIAKEKSVPRSLQYVSPMDGVVLERPAVPGMMAEAGDILFRMVDNSVVWVVADVPEFDFSAVRVGQPVRMSFTNGPGQEYLGTIGLIYPDLQTQTRTGRVRIEVPNPNRTLLANMFAEVEIESGDAAPVVAVQSSAIIDTGSRQIVFVDKGEGRFEARDVQLGMRGGDLVEVRDGLAPGDVVVTSANFLLDAESNLISALNAIAPQAPTP